MSVKKLTSYTMLITGEGARIAYTYSEIGQDGTLISQNNRGNFIVMDADLERHVNAIGDYITMQFLS